VTAKNQRAKLIDVARLAGVSPGTVSNTLHGKRFVEPATRQRVEAAIQQLNYLPNSKASQLRSGSTHSIALLSSVPPSIAAGASKLGFMMEIAINAAQIALEKQHALVLVPPGQLSIATCSFDAAILIEPEANDPLLATLQRSAIPVVTIGRDPESSSVPWVELHSAYTAQILLEHLVEEGATYCALIRGETTRTSSQETEEVYRQWCQGKHPPVIYTLDEKEGEQAGYRAAEDLLTSHPNVDAILVLIDTFATGVVKALLDNDIAIPQRIRIVTRYDGIRARESRPAITAVNMHLDIISQQAVSLLLESMTGQPEYQHPEVLPELVIRNSSHQNERKGLVD